MDRIRVPVRAYRGSNPKKREDARRKALLAHKIEDYLNRRWDEHEEGYLVIMYHEIALDLGEDLEEVSEVAFSVQAGGNGMTFFKEPKTSQKE